MKTTRILGLIIPVLFLIFFVNSSVQSLSFSYPNYNVEIDIFDDTTFEVTEKITSQINGTARGVRRDVTLRNFRRDSNCFFRSDLTCGGFELLVPIGVFDKDNNRVPNAKYYKVEDSEKEASYFRFEWELWPGGELKENYIHEWSVKYKIVGGIQKNTTGRYVFYWNTLPEDRGNIKSYNLKINFPNDINPKLGNFVSYSGNSTPNLRGNSIGIEIPSLNSSTDPQTVSYKFEVDELLRTYGYQIDINSNLFLGASIYWNGLLIGEFQKLYIENFPSGYHEFKIERSGYIPIEYSTDIPFIENSKVDGVKHTFNDLIYKDSYITVIELSPNTMLSFIFLVYNILTIISIFLVFSTPLLIYLIYSKYGKDKDKSKTIIPLFSPPKGMAPYLLGSLKDEKVDREDIVGSIIDLAYRGFLKISEVTKKTLLNEPVFKLTLVQKDFRNLNPIEKYLLDEIFKGRTQVTTTELKSTFYTSYLALQRKIEKEMVEMGYFAKKPSQVRTMYISIAFSIILFGVIFLILTGIFLSGLLGYISIPVFFIFVIFFGFGLEMVSRHMPAKTSLGSRIFGEILGFRMYMYTAERYRLQNLEPEDFEKYLSYAIVFGIEKQWAQKFDGIYKGSPEWFEGSNLGVLDVWVLSNFARSFSNTAVQTIAPASSGSGSGWSGSGSFGGFSGGGGGGGSVGGW